MVSEKEKEKFSDKQKNIILIEIASKPRALAR